MAAPFYIGVSPHGWNSTSVGCAAAIQASAGMPNFLIYEYMVGVEAVSRDVTIGYLEPEEGYIELPRGPGLGIDVDEQALKARPAVTRTRGSVRTVEDERKWH